MFQDNKNRAVVDIHDLNNIIEVNSYFLLLQSKIIVSMIEYLYISTINAVD